MVDRERDIRPDDPRINYAIQGSRVGVLTRVAAECGGSPPTHILPCYPGPLYGLVRHSTAAFRASGISGRPAARRFSASPKVRCEIEIRFGAFDAEAASRLGEVWPPAGAQRESYPGAVDAPVVRDNRSLVELLLPVPPDSGSVTPSGAGSGSAACICSCG